MEFLRLLKRCIIRQRLKETSRLETLPNEILQYINTFLPTPAAAAFALCNHRLYFVLGNNSWGKLARTQQQREKEREFNDTTKKRKLASWDDFREPPPQGEREEFLSLLDRDLPKLILCRQCALFHPDNSRYEGQRLCSRSQWLRFIWYDLYFTRIQMTMKRYRFGLDYTWQLRCLSSYFTHYKRGVRDSSHQRVEARVAGGKFLVRVQYWILLPTGEINLPNSAITGVYVCEHFSATVYSRGPLQDMLKCRMSHWKEQDLECPICSGLKQCSYCNTEFQIDAREVSPRGFTIAITKWWDLGPGISPYDPEYQRHCHSERSHPEGIPQVNFEAGSIQGAFEGNQEFSIDSLLKANQSLLKYCIPHVN